MDCDRWSRHFLRNWASAPNSRTLQICLHTFIFWQVSQTQSTSSGWDHLSAQTYCYTPVKPRQELRWTNGQERAYQLAEHQARVCAGFRQGQTRTAAIAYHEAEKRKNSHLLQYSEQFALTSVLLRGSGNQDRDIAQPTEQKAAQNQLRKIQRLRRQHYAVNRLGSKGTGLSQPWKSHQLRFPAEYHWLPAESGQNGTSSMNIDILGEKWTCYYDVQEKRHGCDKRIKEFVFW